MLAAWGEGEWPPDQIANLVLDLTSSGRAPCSCRVLVGRKMQEGVLQAVRDLDKKMNKSKQSTD